MTPVTTEAEILLPAAPAEVFGVLLDPTRYEAWQPLHAGWPEGVPVIAPGSSFVQRTSYGGRTADVRWTVDRLEEPRAVTLRGTGPMGLRLEAGYLLDDAGRGTRLTATSAAEGGPLSGPMKRIARKRAQGVADETLRRLEAVVDGVPAPPPPEEPPAVLRVARALWDVVPGAPLVTGLLRRVPVLRRVV